ncbi:MAG: excinuclease ABC subunit UvrC [Rhodospirillaceae bacterium]|nr:excinuclease ABC subunit UvrC [Rhodospirillaceae bacterium]
MAEKSSKLGTNPASFASGKKHEQGRELIASLARNLPSGPGVYRMIGSEAPGVGSSAAGLVLYVGKAKNLKKRVLSYTNQGKLSPRIQRMVCETRGMEFVTTHTEAEALLLEANLIKKLRPRYNILLRDDKSFPEIAVEKTHDFPRVIKHRGVRNANCSYFGPFASTWAVNETITTLQRAFLLRTCSDAVYSSRTRPCLLYQIKRCSGPCVGKISKRDYSLLVGQATEFLKGKSRKIQKSLADEMQKASDAQKFEQAAQFRDRIKALTRIQGHQDINPGTVVDADVVAIHQEDGKDGSEQSGRGAKACVQVFFFRGGRNFGNRAFYPAHTAGETPAAVLEAFMGQFYSTHTPPPEILLSHNLASGDAAKVMASALSERAEKKVTIKVPSRGDRARLVAHALENARGALARKKSENETHEQLLAALAQTLGIDQPLERIEVYDNSHVSGTNQVGVMIVTGPEGFVRGAYRKFNIKGAIQPGDDYAMMREVLSRRFTRAMKGQQALEGALSKEKEKNWGGLKNWDMPDLVVIDGGKGQLGVAMDVFADLGIGGVALSAISKGPERNAGREQIHMPGKSKPLILDERDPVLYFLQRIRDEAHRFAIGSHRKKRSKSLTRSGIDDIPGVGPGRKKALLQHFGSSSGIKEAGLSDLEGVKGISSSTAKRIYDWFHQDN